MTDITLGGLDGANPLGFFAAVGTLLAVTDAGHAARLSWRHDGGWRPILESPVDDVASLVALLDGDRRSRAGSAALAIEYDGKRDLKPPRTVFRNLLLQIVESSAPDRRQDVDLAAAFGTDLVVDGNGNTKPTAFHFTAGQQQFLQMVNDLAAKVGPDDFAEALNGPWRYNRPLPVLGWDSTASRDYALRASAPSTDKKFGVPGADWLAVRGLAAFPVVARQSRLETTGCTGGWKDGSFTWPLWSVPLTPVAVRVVVGLNVSELGREERQARGLSAVFTSRIRRHDTGGRGSFEPAAVA